MVAENLKSDVPWFMVSLQFPVRLGKMGVLPSMRCILASKYQLQTWACAFRPHKYAAGIWS